MTLLFTCPDCGFDSSHPEDIKNCYCIRCHQFKVCALCNARNVRIRDGLCAGCCDWLEAREI